MSDLLRRMSLCSAAVAEKMRHYTVIEKGCWEYAGGLNHDGYGVIHTSSPEMEPRHRSLKAHRVSYAYHNKIDPNEMLVCHRCDNPSCINPAHLFLGTNKENTQDMIKKGRAACHKGENNGGAKATREIVLHVVALIKKGKGNKFIAASLPITHSQVSLIRLGKSWKELLNEVGYIPEDYRKFNRTTS